MDRIALELRWLQLTRRLLPDEAAAREWPVRLDHCFQRILLDNACGCCWYDVIAGRPAYRRAADEVLARAVGYGEAVLCGVADLHQLNARSLAWRDKADRDERFRATAAGRGSVTAPGRASA